MDLHAAEKLARELLHEHGLFAFKFRWSNSKSQAGLTSRYRISDKQPPATRMGTISLSRLYVQQWDESVVRETMLHEIAHALVPTTVQSHGPEWRAMALKIGSNGRRTVDPEDRLTLDADAYKWIKYCPAGHSRLCDRRSSKRISCGKCSNVFSSKYLFQFIENTATNRAMVAALKDGGLATVTTLPVKPKQTSTPRMRVAAKSATPSRAAEFDNGSAFINWD